MKNTALEEHIWRWLDEVVIGQNFCPFAKRVRDDASITLRITDAVDPIDVLAMVGDELHSLQNTPEKSTSIIALSCGFEDFYHYLDLVDAVDALIEAEGFSGTFQCASFHPDYVFAEEGLDDVSHFTNRSPVPLLHIIREQDITAALASFREPESIPMRNKQHARKLGKAFFQLYLK